MDSNSNRNRIPAELQDIEDTLRANRHEASPLELDRIKLQAIRQAAQGRPSFLARQKGAFMKSRLAMMLVIAAGFMLSTTGAGLAISGSSGSGSAAESQYVPTGTGGNHHQHPEQGVKGANESGGNEPENNTLQPTSEVEVAPVATEQQAVVSNGSSLPFTGFVAIPLLIIGLALIVVGSVLRLKSRNRPVA